MHTGWQKGSLGSVDRRWGGQRRVNDLTQGILTNSLGAWKEEQETDGSEAEEGSKHAERHRRTAPALC